MEILKRSYVRYGLLMSGAIASCLLLMYVSGDYSKMQGTSIEGSIVSLALPLIVYTLGIHARKRAQKGKLTFKDGVKEGFKISVVAAITSPFVFLLFYVFFNPNLVDYAREIYRMQGQSDGMVVAVDMIVQFIGSIVIGLVYSAVISLFLKNRS